MPSCRIQIDRYVGAMQSRLKRSGRRRVFGRPWSSVGRIQLDNSVNSLTVSSASQCDDRISRCLRVDTDGNEETGVAAPGVVSQVSLNQPFLNRCNR